MKNNMDRMTSADQRRARVKLTQLEQKIEATLKRAEVIPIRRLLAFKKIHAIITLDIGGIPFAMKHKHVKVHEEKFGWKDRSFPTMTERILYVDGSEPVVLYDYNTAKPPIFAKASSQGPSSAAFNRLFKRNLIEQALAALEKTGFQLNGILALVLGLAVGYVLAGVVGAPPLFGGGGGTNHTVTTTITGTSVRTAS